MDPALPGKGGNIMATISAMANNTYAMYKMAQNNGLSLFGTSTSSTSTAKSTSSATSSTSLSSISSNAKSSSEAIVNSWKNAATQASEDMKTLTSIKSGIQGLMSSYTSTNKAFYAEYDSTMSDLKDAASTVKYMNFDFGKDDITTNADGTKTYSSGLKAAIKNVSNLVSAYNDALQFTSDNAEVSDRMKALSSNFADTTYHAGQYSTVGITVDTKTGALSLDEDKLAKALTENSDATEYTLGRSGLAGKAETHIEQANHQRSKLFPSMKQMIGGEMEVASLYTGKALQGMTTYASVGNLLNFMF